MVDLPRPDVTVSQPAEGGREKLDVTISRDGKSDTFRSEKYSTTERVKDVVEQIIGTGKTAEWLP